MTPSLVSPSSVWTRTRASFTPDVNGASKSWRAGGDGSEAPPRHAVEIPIVVTRINAIRAPAPAAARDRPRRQRGEGSAGGAAAEAGSGSSGSESKTLSAGIQREPVQYHLPSGEYRGWA